MARTSAQQKLGKRIKYLRRQSGITQEQLSERTGLSRSYISDTETGRRNPSIKNIAKLARGLGVKVSEFTDF